jgi:O-antigen/teichoic acid export membrane protein
MIQLALASLFQSKFMQIYASDGALSATQYLKEFSLMIYRLLVGVAGISMFFAATIVWVLYGNAYTDSATALVILGPSMISSVVQSIFIFTLTLVSANSGRTNYRS